MEFEFKWLNEEGHPQGFWSVKGHFDGHVLQLGDRSIPLEIIADCEARQNRVVVAIANVLEEATYLAFQIYAWGGHKGEALAEEIRRARAQLQADARREQLRQEGRAADYRDANCPHCRAVIDLSGKPATPQVCCNACQCMSTLDNSPHGQERTAAEKGYRICEECGMYSKPEKFTIFYFYFLLVVYGFSSKETWRCPACMRPEAWNMLLGNLLFVLGVPVALCQLYRCYVGNDIDGLYKGLDGANTKARKGQFNEAIDAYQTILQEHPTAAGVKYNIGLAFLMNDDVAGGARMFEYVLKDCSNYQPAARMLTACYEELGETKKLAELLQQWDAEPSESGDEAPQHQPDDHLEPALPV